MLCYGEAIRRPWVFGRIGLPLREIWGPQLVVVAAIDCESKTLTICAVLVAYAFCK